MWDLCSLHPSCISPGKSGVSTPGTWQSLVGGHRWVWVRLWGPKVAPVLALPTAPPQVVATLFPSGTPRVAPPLQEEPQSKHVYFEHSNLQKQKSNKTLTYHTHIHTRTRTHACCISCHFMYKIRQEKERGRQVASRMH